MCFATGRQSESSSSGSTRWYAVHLDHDAFACFDGLIRLRDILHDGLRHAVREFYDVLNSLAVCHCLLRRGASNPAGHSPQEHTCKRPASPPEHRLRPGDGIDSALFPCPLLRGPRTQPAFYSSPSINAPRRVSGHTERRSNGLFPSSSLLFALLPQSMPASLFTGDYARVTPRSMTNLPRPAAFLASQDSMT